MEARTITVDRRTIDDLYRLQNWLIKVEDALGGPYAPAATRFTEWANQVGMIIGSWQIAGLPEQHSIRAYDQDSEAEADDGAASGDTGADSPDDAKSVAASETSTDEPSDELAAGHVAEPASIAIPGVAGSSSVGARYPW